MVKLQRPKVVGSINVKVVTGCGNMYIQLGWWNGGLHEIFATLGRSGGCAMSYGEALTRSITTGLRSGVDASEYIDQLKGVRCPNQVAFPKENEVLSCADAIGKILEKYGSLTTGQMIMLIQNSSGIDNPLSEEDERKIAVDSMQKLKDIREEQGL